MINEPTAKASAVAQSIADPSSILDKRALQKFFSKLG